jgi:hypothetical protein
MQYIQDAAGPEAHVIFGYGNDESMGDTLQVTVIATGFNPDTVQRRPAATVVRREPEPVTDEVAAPMGEFSEEAAASSSVPEEDQRIEILMEDLSEAIGEPPAAPDSEWTEPQLELRPRGTEPVSEQVAEAPQEFLARAAAGGGADVIRPADPAAPAVTGAEHPAAGLAAEPSQPFLRPVGTRDIGEVESPAWPAKPASLNRSVASGLGPDNPADDLQAPAYTRKYMD